MSDPRALIIWRFTDGKAGHENQSAGLVQALGSKRQIEVHDLPAPHAMLSTVTGLIRWFPWGDTLPDPDLLIGAGHATHAALLAARRARGGRSLVLMRPSLPTSWFDLCLIPTHDTPPNSANIIATHGVLNRIRPGAAKDPRKGLLLIGGPSRHHGWSNAQIIEQVSTILARTTDQRWLLTTSRRTPDDFIPTLRQQVTSERLDIVPFADTASDWLPTQLAWAGQVWVSADSVSMLYESLTAGAAVGVLDVPILSQDRVVRGVEQLQQDELVTAYQAWLARGELRAPKQIFNEAARCAQEIERRWLNGN